MTQPDQLDDKLERDIRNFCNLLREAACQADAKRREAQARYEGAQEILDIYLSTKARLEARATEHILTGFDGTRTVDSTKEVGW